MSGGGSGSHALTYSAHAASLICKREGRKGSMSTDREGNISKKKKNLFDDLDDHLPLLYLISLEISKLNVRFNHSRSSMNIQIDGVTI